MKPTIQKQYVVPGRSKESLYQAIESRLTEILDSLPLQGVKVVHEPDQSQILLSASAFQGRIRCESESVLFEAELSLLARPFKAKVETLIDRMIEKHFLS